MKFRNNTEKCHCTNSIKNEPELGSDLTQILLKTGDDVKPW